MIVSTAGGESGFGRSPRAWPYILAGTVGAATLGFELVAARVANLLVGVSLYGWTGVIGATLAGLALGFAIGARQRSNTAAADARLVGTWAITAAIAAVGATLLLTAPPVALTLERVPRIARLPLPLVFLAFIPALLLGLAVPSLARRAIDTQHRLGQRAGGLGAALAAGNLVGAFTTGVWLIPAVGTRGSSLVWAGALVLASGRPWPLVPLVVLGAVALATPHACLRESAYQCIAIRMETGDRGRAVHVLYLDGLPHTHVVPDDPRHLAHDYLIPVVEVAASLRPVGEPPPTILIIGGGGYSLARYFRSVYPNAPVEVFEIDPVVTEVARGWLGLTDDPLTRIVHGDARQTLRLIPADRRYDLIVLDAFADIVVPMQFVTAEFNALVASHLNPDGRYIALVHDRTDRGRLLPAYVRTMEAAFPAVDVLAAGPGVRWRSPLSRTWAVVGAPAALEEAQLRRALRFTANGPFPTLSEIMPATERARLRALPGPPILTDDHAPVEQLALLLFE
ncbi:MAG: hypothetical protein FJ033_14270 [Chloroflexi bacterium]|nr:hypothetical protein [Chloroflexota bacterium]